MKIGIGITTRNRPDALRATLAELRRFWPNTECSAVVVDDASDNPTDYDFRFEDNVGIARAKNKCIELLMEQGCTDLFLFDDDTYPVAGNWWKPYIDSPQPHLMYVFVDFANGQKLGDTEVVYNDGAHVAYSHARGCMLYINAECVETIGGFDTAFGKWGWEHINYSDRIHAAGLTTFAYTDVAGSAALFHSGDEHKDVVTTVGGPERNRQHTRNTALYHARAGSAYWCDYRDGIVDTVITTYFTGTPDPQRGTCWEANIAELDTLRNSVRKIADMETVVLNDCFDELECGFLRVPSGGLSPYWQRWIAIYEYLRTATGIRNVWCVDATDVTMLRNPFPDMDPGTIYVGDEQGKTLATAWMFNQHPARFLHQCFRTRRTSQLLNCGLVGGSRENVMEFIRTMLDLWVKNRGDVKFRRELSVGETEMGLFNYVCYERFESRLMSGPKVNTVFKKNADNGSAWWKHK